MLHRHRRRKSVCRESAAGGMLDVGQSGLADKLHSLDCRVLAGRLTEVSERLFDHSLPPEELQAIRAELLWLADMDESANSEVLGASCRAKIEKEHAHRSWYEQLFQQVRRARLEGAPEPDVDWSLIADRINKRFRYKPPRNAFRPVIYQTYEDWFLRELSEETCSTCLHRASTADVCSPVQAKVWNEVPSGEMTLKISVIAVEDLLHLVNGARLVQFSLRWPDYHRVHSPVDGQISRIEQCDKDQLFPGAESMTIISIDTTFGLVRLLCIGEWSVQTFVLRVEVGQRVTRMHELGHFDSGSQVILVLPRGVEVVVQGGDKVFPGDPIGMIADDDIRYQH